MGDTTKANVLLLAPELKDKAGFDDLYELLAADVRAEITEAIYGSQQERAQRYMVAHLATLSGVSSSNADAVGPLVTEKVGDVSKTYGLVQWAGGVERLDETRYGRVFMTIRKATVMSFRTFKPGGLGG